MEYKLYESSANIPNLTNHFNKRYSTDKILPVESTPSGQMNLVSVAYTCIQINKY